MSATPAARWAAVVALCSVVFVASGKIVHGGTEFPAMSTAGTPLGTCEFVSNAESPFTFNFDLTLLNNYDETGDHDQVVKETPPGHTLIYYASPCDDLNTGAVPGFAGTCTGDMAVCFCSSDFGKCESIGNRDTIEWMYPATPAHQNTVIQKFTAPNCDSNATLDWTTYLIYKCDTSSYGYGQGHAFNANSDQFGLCIEDNTNNALCTQCVEWSTNYACAPFASPRESVVSLGSGFNSELTYGGSQTSVFSVIARSQFRQAYGKGGDNVQVTFQQNSLSTAVVDNGDGTYTVTLTPNGPQYVGAEDMVVENGTVTMNQVDIGYVVVAVRGNPGTPQNPPTGGLTGMQVVLVVLGVCVALAAAAYGVNMVRRKNRDAALRRNNALLASRSAPGVSGSPPSVPYGAAAAPGGLDATKAYDSGL